MKFITDLFSGGNVFGASLSAKAGFSQSESQAMASSQSSSARTMNITYNVRWLRLNDAFSTV
jgi:hypothetical protein